MSEHYQLNSRDWGLIEAARLLLMKLAASGVVSPAQRVTVARMQYVLDRLPRSSPDLDIAIDLCGPDIKAGEVMARHAWRIEIEDERLSISTSGYFVGPNGGDSFNSMGWEAYPGQESDFDDYSDSLWMVPGLRPFAESVARIDFTEPGYVVQYVGDSGNELLDEEEEGEEEDEDLDEDENVEEDDDEDDSSFNGGGADAPAAWRVTPVDKLEARYAERINREEVDGRPPQKAYGAKNCDQCGVSFVQRGLFADARLRGQAMWANLCIPCFDALGAGLGWGTGQLFARQPNGDWRLVVGFPPKDRKS